ncbi:MAG: hypothetical protein ACR2GW_07345 [Pyrinomonadaceae bacterium]|nr:hypothetical protein [Pyrinomonadaceae bacterium]
MAASGCITNGSAQVFPALHTQTGGLLWSLNTDRRITSTPSIKEELSYFGSQKKPEEQVPRMV